MYKNTLLTLALVAAATQVANADLLYGLDYNDSSDRYANVGTGSLDITTTGSPNFWGHGDTAGDGSISLSAPTFSIGDNSGSIGINGTDGFTVFFNAHITQNWGDLLTLSFGEGNTLKFENQGSTMTGLGVYTTGSCPNGEVALSESPFNQWVSVSMTVLQGIATTYVHDADGVLLGSLEMEYNATLAGDVTKITDGGTQTKSVMMDNIGIYDCVLSEAQLSQLSIDTNSDANALKASVNIPEPSTATLSLLSLAGLMARRRRK